jgi:hypothetical protein
VAVAAAMVVVVDHGLNKAIQNSGGFGGFVRRRDDEAMVELKKALNLDPLSLIINADLADALCVAGRFDEAVERSRKTLQMRLPL